MSKDVCGRHVRGGQVAGGVSGGVLGRASGGASGGWVSVHVIVRAARAARKS